MRKKPPDSRPAREARDLRPTVADRLAGFAANRRRGRRMRLGRRVLAIALVVVAGAHAISVRNGPDAGLAGLVLTRDLGTGAVLGQGDVTVSRFGKLPDGALRSPPAGIGRALNAPVRRGEILTDARLVPAAGPAPGPGRAAVPIRPSDPGTATLLSPGTHVAVIAVDDRGTGSTVTHDAVVLSVTAAPAGITRAAGDSALVVLSVPNAVADRVAALAISGGLTLRFT